MAIPQHLAGELPAGIKLDLSAVDVPLFTTVTQWLKKRRKAIRPKLTQQQKEELQQAFRLMDEDGSGAIDVDELGSAFKLLGIRKTKAEIEELVNEVDHDGTGELEYPEFLEIMTDTLHRLSEEAHEEGNKGQVPFALMATAYRRKKLLEGIMEGGREALDQIVASGEEEEKERAANQAAREAAAAEAQRLKALANGKNAAPRGALKLLQEKAQIQPWMLADVLGPQELKFLAQIASKTLKAPAPPASIPQAAAAAAAGSTTLPPVAGARAAAAGTIKPSPPAAAAAAGSMPPPRRSIYGGVASHQALMEVPKVFDTPLRFSRSYIKQHTSPGAMGAGRGVNLSPSRTSLSGTLSPTPSCTTISNKPSYEDSYRAAGGSVGAGGRSGGFGPQPPSTLANRGGKEGGGNHYSPRTSSTAIRLTAVGDTAQGQYTHQPLGQAVHMSHDRQYASTSRAAILPSGMPQIPGGLRQSLPTTGSAGDLQGLVHTAARMEGFTSAQRLLRGGPSLAGDGSSPGRVAGGNTMLIPVKGNNLPPSVRASMPAAVSVPPGGTLPPRRVRGVMV